MDISSVRRPPVPAMVPADRVSAHDLPLAPLAVVERELFHSGTTPSSSDTPSFSHSRPNQDYSLTKLW